MIGTQVDQLGTIIVSIYIRDLQIGRLHSNRIRIELGATIRIRITNRIGRIYCLTCSTMVRRSAVLPHEHKVTMKTGN